MPTAAAVAAAAATAKIQAMEAVTNTAAAFGLAKDVPRLSNIAAIPGLETSPKVGFGLAPLSAVLASATSPLLVSGAVYSIELNLDINH